MLTSKDLTTLNFLEFSSNGRRYIRAYKNEWVSKKVTGKDKGVSCHLNMNKSDKFV